MTTGNTLSAGSSIHTMLLSAVDGPIGELARCGDNRPILIFPVEDLDAILDGTYQYRKGLEADLLDGRYFHELLPAIGWWVEVTQALSIGRFESNESVFDRRKDKIIELLNDALSSYAAALAEGNYFCDNEPKGAPASIKFIKRYRLYTRAVCELAKEILPYVDLDWLFQQA